MSFSTARAPPPLASEPINREEPQPWSSEEDSLERKVGLPCPGVSGVGCRCSVQPESSREQRTHCPWLWRTGSQGESLNNTNGPRDLCSCRERPVPGSSMSPSSDKDIRAPARYLPHTHTPLFQLALIGQVGKLTDHAAKATQSAESHGASAF